MGQLAEHLQTFLPQTKFEKITDGVALVGTASPFWLPWLQQWSAIAGYALPIAGLIWLVVQIVSKVLITRTILRGGRKADHP